MPAPSFDDLYELARAELFTRRPELALNEGDVTDFWLASIAAIGEYVAHHATVLAKRTYIDGATGEDLERLIEDHFVVSKGQATAASGTVAFSRLTTANGSGSIPSGTTVGTDFNTLGQRLEFTTDSTVVFGASDTVKTVTVTATVTGPEGDANEETVVNIVDAVFDANITVSNPQAIAGGNNVETDAQYRDRARKFYTTLRRGTLAALEYGALQVPSVRYATASQNDETGLVTVFVTDDAGNSNVEMIDDVTAELVDWQVAGVVPRVVGGILCQVNMTIALVTRAGFDVSAMETAIADTVTEEVARLKVADVLYDSIVISAVRNVDPINILDVTVSFNSSSATISADGTVATPPLGGLIRANSISVS